MIRQCFSLSPVRFACTPTRSNNIKPYSDQFIYNDRWLSLVERVCEGKVTEEPLHYSVSRRDVESVSGLLTRALGGVWRAQKGARVTDGRSHTDHRRDRACADNAVRSYEVVLLEEY
mmetsp:Transcript_16897/g.36742  ORF Transcript_16897/g.36742 Transcript_16897/m.36742 type:complete len:117 (+) Transcript_16897:592-942(+)